MAGIFLFVTWTVLWHCRVFLNCTEFQRPQIPSIFVASLCSLYFLFPSLHRMWIAGRNYPPKQRRAYSVEVKDSKLLIFSLEFQISTIVSTLDILRRSRLLERQQRNCNRGPLTCRHTCLSNFVKVFTICPLILSWLPSYQRV